MVMQLKYNSIIFHLYHTLFVLSSLMSGKLIIISNLKVLLFILDSFHELLEALLAADVFEKRVDF